MTKFYPSHQFAANWFALTQDARQAFRQELDDISNVLNSDVSIDDFHFYYDDFGLTIKELLGVDLDTTITPNQEQESQVALQYDIQELPEQELLEIEKRIYDKLAVQIDDVLSEHMSQLSDDLKEWLKSAISNELSKHIQA